MSQRKNFIVTGFFIAGLLFYHYKSDAQNNDSNKFITLPASTKYHKSGAYQKKWGFHYRKEWHTPVSFPKALLDTLAGGISPYQTGGSRQSKSLRLRDKAGREYVLRSIDKSYEKALPEILQGTFVEALVNDQVTMGHPYAAVTIAPMADAAGILHANPSILYIPKQPALGNFNDSMGNTLYLFEQRPDENWETADNFGNAKKIISTEKMLEKILKDNDNQVDQQAFVKARLFDMLIGDWGRHEDQWRWAAMKTGKTTLYEPIPRDRDQVYTLFDGSRLKRIIAVTGVKHLQSFDSTIKDVIRFNFPARNLDFHLTTQVSAKQWMDIAMDLQNKLTDKVIENAILKLPPEVYHISGPEIITKLKGRRNHLIEYAKTYAGFLAYEVDITGTEDNELFDIKRLNDKETEISIYKISKEDNKIKETPFYHRVFNSDETKEIRLYGIDGNDRFHAIGNVQKAIKIRLIGGQGKDVYDNESVVNNDKRNLFIYDDYQNEIKTKSSIVKKLSGDSSVHNYVYDQFQFDKKGFRPLLLYNFEDRFYTGIAYKKTKAGWRKKPFARQHYMDVKYSLSQKAFSTTYEGIFTEVVGKWNLKFHGNYDQIRWNNYFGLGNETIFETAHRDYNRIRSQRFSASPALERIISGKHKITISPFFESVDLIADTGRYLAKQPVGAVPDIYKAKSFAGAGLSYVFQKLDDSVLSTKGISFTAWGNYTAGINNESSFAKYGTEARLFIPLSKKFGVSLKAGGASLNGDAIFYQYPAIGGSYTLRGYQRDRFHGQSIFYNQNELRWITNLRTHLVNGKIGLFTLYDMGRVWMPNEKSNTIHSGYGGGLLFSPFNKIAISVAYAVSPEERYIHINLIKPL